MRVEELEASSFFSAAIELINAVNMEMVDVATQAKVKRPENAMKVGTKCQPSGNTLVNVPMVV